MQNESQNNINASKVAPNLLWRFLSLLKRYWFVILAAVILFSVAGVVYVQYKKPVYTATERAMVIARISEGNANNFNATQIYLPTIKDMGKQGVVIDRANFYYQKYLESAFSAIGDIEGFIKEIDTISYTSAGEQKYFSSGNINISYTVDTDSTWINVAYSDEDKSVVIAKSKILTEALDQELKVRNLENDDKYTFISISVESWGNTGVYSNVGYKKTITLCVIFGLIAGVAVAYIFSMFDRTLKTEEELESITGVNNLALIKAEKEGV